jgi:hypothetical protein
VDPSATTRGEAGNARRSSTTIEPRSRWSDISNISAGVDRSQRSPGVSDSQRCAAAIPAASARSRCAQVCVSALYRRRPWRRASRVAIVVFPEPGGPPIQRTCFKRTRLHASAKAAAVPGAHRARRRRVSPRQINTSQCDAGVIILGIQWGIALCWEEAALLMGADSRNGDAL